MAKRCRFCGKRFPTDIALKQHLKERHKRYYYGLRAGILALAILALVASGYAYSASLPRSPTTAASFSYSKPAPDFTLPEVSFSGLTGRKISLSDFYGKPVFLEFLSPLCGHCLKMTPIIKDLQERYGSEVVFISVMLANASDEASLKISMEFIKKNEAYWIHVVDSDVSVFAEYGVKGTPTYVILNKEHTEVARFIGSGTSEKDLENALRSIL